MTKIQLFKLLLFDTKEFAFEILAEPIRKKIGQCKRSHKSTKGLYDELQRLRRFRTYGREKRL